MIVFSKLKSVIQLTNTLKNGQIQRAMSEHRVMQIKPSNWTWNNFKDVVHFYVLLGAIPLFALIIGTNIFIGPATLSEIPEGYEPKYWEYYKSPITRFIARYILTNPQQDYEKYLFYLYTSNERKQFRMIEKQVKDKIMERNDYQAYYYKPVLAKYNRMTRETRDYLGEVTGDK